MRVLFVSKPIVPPFHDGSKSLVTALCRGMRAQAGVEPSVLGAKGQAVLGANVVGLYPDPERAAQRGVSRFAPALFDNAKALAYLGVERRAELWHFVFAPNPRASKAISALRHLRNKPCVQTIASPPRSFEQIDDLLFGDIVVAQSEWTARQIAENSRRGFKTQVIYPPLTEPREPSAAEQEAVRQRLGVSAEQQLLVFPGDLEFGGGAQRTAELAKRFPGELQNTTVVFACRQKTPRAAEIQQQLKAELARFPAVFAGELPSLLPLLKTASAVLFPVSELFGKVDLPISLLEAMALSTPVITAERGPASELQGAVTVNEDEPAAWLQTLVRLQREPAWRQELISAQLAGIAERHNGDAAAASYAQLYAQLGAAVRGSA